MKGVFSIGQFSRITGLTVKTLRLYHEKELIVPSWVDGETGYRYYTQREAERARAVADLKTLEFPLAEIKELLDGFDDEAGTLAFLETQRARLSQRRQGLARAERQIARLIRGEREALALAEAAPTEARLVDLAPMVVAGLRWKGRYAETGPVFGRVARSCGRAIVGPPLNLYYDEDYHEDDADIETCFPVREGTRSSECTVRTLPGGRFAAVMHRGPYEELGRSYARLFAELRRQKLSAGRPVREIYRKGPGMLWRGNPRNYLTEILLPLIEP